MAKYIGYGETVEGAATDLCSRKWVQKGPKKHPITNKTMFLYVGDRNTSVEVTKAIGEPEDEELKTKTAHFHRNVGDILQIQGWKKEDVFIIKRCLRIKKGNG